MQYDQKNPELRRQVLRLGWLFMVQTKGKRLPTKSILGIIPSFLIWVLCVDEEDPAVDVCYNKLIRVWYCCEVNFNYEFCVSWVVTVIIVFMVMLLVLASCALYKWCPNGYTYFLEYSTSLWLWFHSNCISSCFCHHVNLYYYHEKFYPMSLYLMRNCLNNHFFLIIFNSLFILSIITTKISQITSIKCINQVKIICTSRSIELFFWLSKVWENFVNWGNGW